MSRSPAPPDNSASSSTTLVPMGAPTTLALESKRCGRLNDISISELGASPHTRVDGPKTTSPSEELDSPTTISLIKTGPDSSAISG
ncbi:hypothetical protein [Proteus mirabilis]|uniref:hypothetical protein n=1 Tax=Proteus mirabilis TaxID=584 RepID=UPI003EDAD425